MREWSGYFILYLYICIFLSIFDFIYYFAVFKAKRGEMEWVVKRSGLNLENAMDDGCVRLRGLPFGCSKEEIAQFFSGIWLIRMIIDVINNKMLMQDFFNPRDRHPFLSFLNIIYINLFFSFCTPLFTEDEQIIRFDDCLGNTVTEYFWWFSRVTHIYRYL